MKKYVITLSENFPATHSKKGQPTNFISSIKNENKKHTIRRNYHFWKKRIDEIKKGNAQLHVRTWSKKPYASPQVEHFVLGKEHGVGIQKFTQKNKGFRINGIDNFRLNHIAENDGLSLDDFKEWFKKVEAGEELAIIHFGKFRYL